MRAGWLVFGLKIALAAGAYAWLMNNGRLNVAMFKSLDAAKAALLSSLTILALVIPAVRWWTLLKTQDVIMPLGKAVQITWAGYFASLLFPGAAAGDGVKAVILSLLTPHDRMRAVTTIFVDRVIGLYSLLLLAGISSVFMIGSSESEGSWRSAAVGCLQILLIATMLAAAALVPAIQRRFFSWLPIPIGLAWNSYQHNKAALAICLSYSLGSSLLTIFSLMVAFQATGINVSFFSAFQAGPLALIASCLPFTPGGLGVGEAAAETAFGWYGFTGGAAAMLLVRLSTILWSLLGIFVSIPPADSKT